MDPLKLIEYCTTYQNDIFVRVHRERWENLPLSELTAAEVLERLQFWIVTGHTPIRVLDDPAPNGAAP
jgi:hypothetical protein